MDLYNKGIKELENGILLSFERNSGIPELKEHIQARKLQHKVNMILTGSWKENEVAGFVVFSQ